MSHQAKILRYATCSSLFIGSSKRLVCDMTISMLIFCILGIFGVPLTQMFILIACKQFFLGHWNICWWSCHCLQWFSLLKCFKKSFGKKFCHVKQWQHWICLSIQLLNMVKLVKYFFFLKMNIFLKTYTSSTWRLVNQLPLLF